MDVFQSPWICIKSVDILKSVDVFKVSGYVQSPWMCTKSGLVKVSGCVQSPGICNVSGYVQSP